jgi:hypothetical protein
MKRLSILATLLLCSAATAQSVGKMLPASELADLTNTKARTLSEYAGRAILLEFFSYT